VGKNDTVSARIKQIVHDPARSTPIALVQLKEKDEGGKKGEKRFIIIPEGVAVGDEVYYGESAPINVGNTLPLRCIPEGMMVCNIEARENDGGKFVRASGGYATVLAHEEEGKKTVVKLPSGKKKRLSSECFATIGVVAGGGRTEKPFVKAGKKYHKMKSRAAKYPRVRGVAMNPVDHPFGGGAHQHAGKSKTPGKGAPQGRKVGSIMAKRTGRK
jgi:large subunit ribosomal protein L2